MALVGFCAVWGNALWRARAQRVLEVWSKHHDNARTVLLEPGRFDAPDYTKARMLEYVDDGDTAVYMDADTVCLGNTVSCTGWSDFAMCEHGLIKAVRTVEPRPLWINRTYFSTAYMVVKKTPANVELFKMLWDSRRSLCGVYSDQSMLNSILMQQGINPAVLDASCNYFATKGLPPPEGTRVIHWGSIRDSYPAQSTYLTYEERVLGISSRQA